MAVAATIAALTALMISIVMITGVMITTLALFIPFGLDLSFHLDLLHPVDNLETSFNLDPLAVAEGGGGDLLCDLAGRVEDGFRLRDDTTCGARHRHFLLGELTVRKCSLGDDRVSRDVLDRFRFLDRDARRRVGERRLREHRRRGDGRRRGARWGNECWFAGGSPRWVVAMVNSADGRGEYTARNIKRSSGNLARGDGNRKPWER